MNVPLVDAWRDLRRERPPGTVAMYAVIGAVMLVLATVPVCGPIQDQMVRSHHARPSTIVTWPLLQVVPKMYSFAHRTWTSAQPLTVDSLHRSAAANDWINHAPARVMRIERGRADFVERGEDRHLLIRSAYRGRRWVTRFLIHVRADAISVETLGSDL